VPLIPGISAVQGAALRELLISVALLVVLRFYARGLIPERIEHPPLPVVAAAPAVARA
jgi:branched-chain amino acid transport system permease protein